MKNENQYSILIIVLLAMMTRLEALDAKCDCPYKYKRIGCFKDRRGSEALPQMLANERDKNSVYYNGHDIDWADWANYLPQMTCRCAKAAIDKGFKYFGLQHWGECWSGPSRSGEFEYSKYGSGDDCYGPEYKLCQSDDINCVGASSHNFVYEIETYECDVHFEKIGCYKDNAASRSGNEYVLNARNRIDWDDYAIFLRQFACDCAKKVVEAGYDTFGMQFYGECWTGKKFEEKYYIEQGESTNCVNPCYKKCQLWDRFCIGGKNTNEVYRIIHPQCEMKYKSLGCFTAADGAGMNPAVSELLFNEISPSIDNFNGNMLKFDDSWETAYPQLLCRCARAAEQKGYDVFAIRNKGECWSGPSSRETYDQYGESGNCIRKQSEACQDDILCAGDENSINVYQVMGKNLLIGK